MAQTCWTIACGSNGETGRSRHPRLRADRGSGSRTRERGQRSPGVSGSGAIRSSVVRTPPHATPGAVESAIDRQEDGSDTEGMMRVWGKRVVLAGIAVFVVAQFI